MTWILSLISFVIFYTHDYHVAISMVEYSAGTKNIEATHKVFVDDIEKALQKIHGENFIIENQAQETMDSVLFRYFSNHFEFNLNNEPIPSRFVGFEIEELNLMWVYIEYFSGKKPLQLQIKNNLLMEVFDDQSNVVHLYEFGEKKSAYFTQKETRQKVVF